MRSLVSSQQSIDRDDGDIHGECPVCGKYKSRIDRGRMKPCFMWAREKEEDDEDDDDAE